MSIFEKISELEEKGISFAIATILTSKGSSPRHAGSKMLVFGDNEIYGTIGGGAVEQKVREQCLECIRNNESRVFHYELNEKEGEGLNMACGGNVDVFIESFVHSISLVIFGGGHIGYAMSKMADILGYPYSILDDRPDFANKERFPNAKEVICTGNFDEAVKSITIDKKSFVIIATHGHLNDEKALCSVINSKASYIGMIGSKRKVQTIFNNLRQIGIPEDKISSVYSPVGLDIGAETPEEIAISIIAEMIKYNNSSSGKSMREI